MLSLATHERAGEITYKCLAGIPPYGAYTYSITITTYTYGPSTADRCSLLINFGDDTVHYVVCRSNWEPGDPSSDSSVGWPNSCSATPDCSTHHMGQWTIGSPPFYKLNIKKNEYSVIHNYSGPGVYVISMVDANRNHGLINVPDQTPMELQDSLLIWLGCSGMSCNTSPTLVNPPIDFACAGKCFVHNPGAVDPDGDSLAYHLAVCNYDVNTPIPFGPPPLAGSGYFFPSGISVNPITGDFTWCSPLWYYSPPAYPPSINLPYEEYNFAIVIEEWKICPMNGKRYLVGKMRRDFQVNVCQSCSNATPVITAHDTCVLANSALAFTTTATNPDSGLLTAFSATGGPFSTTPSATFSSDAPHNITATGTFNWTPSCNQVHKIPYLVTLKATGDTDYVNCKIALVNFKTIFITVIAPEPKNLQATPVCNAMQLCWNAAPCTTNLYHYKIYRRIGCDSLTPAYCQTGVPASWGYSLIAKVSNTTTCYKDNNGGSGLSQGTLYSYRVVAEYLDGAESRVSNPVCSKLIRDVPIITNVDVLSTSAVNGKINVKWLKPIADSLNFDTILTCKKKPYKFILYRSAGFTNPTTKIATFTSNYFATLDTFYLDTGLNTQSNPYVYRVDFLYDTCTVISSCQAQTASSVFVSCSPSDNKITLTWKENVPWTDSLYDVFRFNKKTLVWDSLGRTSVQTFADTGLANLYTYCYKVKSIGAYVDTTIVHPLINWSQELCCAAVDNEPPCPNTLAVDSSCELSRNILNWTNPNNSCSNDALTYIIYYTPVQHGDFYAIDTIKNISTLTLTEDSLLSIAGCYAVTSVDSFGNQSAYSNIVCVDNCPNYELPNVFSPNGDASNDFFTPLHPYKYVKDIDIKIYDRWGVLVFHTTDPEIHWDGKNQFQTKQICSDGVYYYVCIVNEIRVKGILPRVLKGNVHLLKEK